MEILSGANIYLNQLNALRPVLSELVPNIFPDGASMSKTLVEISGKRKTGKTFLLMQIMAKCLIKSKVIFVNINHKMDYQLFGKIVQQVVQTSYPEATDSQLKTTFEKCLDSFEIINCFSSRDARMAFAALENHVLVGNSMISLVAFDGLGEFYWLDLPPNARMRKFTHYKKFVEEIRKISEKFSVCCMFTVDSSFLTHCHELRIAYKLHLTKKGRRGPRTLNDKNIVIDEKGLHFI